jgi:hypothetical protein
MHESLKEEYRGKEVYERIIRREIGDRLWGLLDLQRGVEFWEWDCISICTGVAGGFGHGGQDIHMISWS